jgi:flagellar assembly protein FliH
LSNFWASAAQEDIRPVGMAGYSAMGSVSGFRALFTEGQRQSPTVSAPDLEQVDPVDPIDQAHAEGFAMGFQEGSRIAAEAAADDREAQIRLAEALEQLSPASSGTLATMLSATVVRLVGQIVGQVEVDVDVLRARCEAVAAFIDEDDTKGALHVNPADLPLIAGADIAVQVVGDPQLRRGCVRLDTADGWIEDGPDVRLSRLKAMLDDMEGKL